MSKTVEICANCGKVAKGSKEKFKCECGSNVCVVVPISIFREMVKSGAAKE
ncbi:hypothetical protein GF318_05300 [Candidatus Micrarchaeota archaeon]|nr:hypothetical protein [Candidatus Micrarchaeota archaeon]